MSECSRFDCQIPANVIVTGSLALGSQQEMRPHLREVVNPGAHEAGEEHCQPNQVRMTSLGKYYEIFSHESVQDHQFA